MSCERPCHVLGRSNEAPSLVPQFPSRLFPLNEKKANGRDQVSYSSCATSQHPYTVRHWPGCMNVASEFRQKNGKECQEQNSPNLAKAFLPSPVFPSLPFAAKTPRSEQGYRFYRILFGNVSIVLQGSSNISFPGCLNMG